jgi:hypothetical protein
MLETKLLRSGRLACIVCLFGCSARPYQTEYTQDPNEVSGTGGESSDSSSDSGSNGSSGGSGSSSDASSFGTGGYPNSVPDSGEPPIVAPQRTCAASNGSDPVIDDFEALSPGIRNVDNRNGFWETFDDSTLGAIFEGKTPIEGVGRDGSHAWCSTVSGYTSWGANVVVSMLYPKCGYDATAYRGVCFWAKGRVDAGGPIVFSVGTADTVPLASGGTCGSDCWFNYQVDLTGLDENTYNQFCYTWDELRQVPWATVTSAFDAQAVLQMEWKFPAIGDADPKQPTDGTICIDDLSFLVAEE